jgi:putative ABC transport system ATP-binding protein
VESSGRATVEARNLVFAWPGQEPVLNIGELTVGASERVFLSGPSGSGKSTLLGLIGGVLPPGSGSLEVLGEKLQELRPPDRDRLRADAIGFIFQQFNLLPFLDVMTNVSLACRFSDRRRERALVQSGSEEAEAKRLLGHLGIHEELLRRPVTQLSIGQQQRVAAARALIGSPGLLIADEPTSALDTGLRAQFIELLLAECESAGTAVLFVSHDLSLSTHFDRSIRLADINQAATADA